MIVDVHTHTPTHRTAVPASERQPNALWRPDRVVEAAVSWDDYLTAMEPVDRACVFGIRLIDGAEAAGREGTGFRYDDETDVNSRTAAFARAMTREVKPCGSMIPLASGGSSAP